MRSAAVVAREPLPEIVRYFGVDDAGEGATCPHCGATGRYIVRFQVRDGRQLGAMRGCAKLFPVSALAREHGYLIEKKARRAKQGWRLSQRDQEVLDKVEAAIDGNFDEHHAIVIAESARRAAAARYRR